MVMTKKLIIAIAIVVAFASHALAANLGTARLTLIKGDAALYDEEAGEWSEAAINMPLMEGDRLWVQEGGRAEIHLRGRTYIRLAGDSTFDIVKLGREEAHFYLASGRFYVSDEEYGIEDISVETPGTEIRSRDGSVFKVDVFAAGETEVSVLRGYVTAEDRSGRSRIREGQTFSVYEDRYAERGPLGEADEWERWNRRRDRRLAEYAEGRRYLPGELHEYAYDFDAHGRWVHVAAYGYVWTPSVSVGVTWAPYRHGGWRWVRDNYVWVSYEPWGWIPYHFGRWVHVSRVGWCWVPPRHRQLVWAPGLVAWVTSSSHVAWVPLAPGEIYYGYGRYGPKSVNIININLRKTIVKPVYRNVHVHNSVTVVHRDTFLTGKKIALKTRHNPFLKGKPSYGPPGIKWRRAEKHRVVKKIKVYEKPGKHRRVIKTKRVHEGKERRVTKAVKQRNRPVYADRKERLERKAPKGHVPSGKRPEKITRRIKNIEKEEKQVQRVRKPVRKAEGGRGSNILKRKTPKRPELNGRPAPKKERHIVKASPQRTKEARLKQKPRDSKGVKTLKPTPGGKPLREFKFTKRFKPAKRNGFGKAKGK
jgi:hypothetical protein